MSGPPASMANCWKRTRPPRRPASGAGRARRTPGRAAGIRRRVVALGLTAAVPLTGTRGRRGRCRSRASAAAAVRPRGRRGRAALAWWDDRRRTSSAPMEPGMAPVTAAATAITATAATAVNAIAGPRAPRAARRRCRCRAVSAADGRPAEDRCSASGRRSAGGYGLAAAWRSGPVAPAAPWPNARNAALAAASPASSRRPGRPGARPACSLPGAAPAGCCPPPRTAERRGPSRGRRDPRTAAAGCLACHRLERRSRSKCYTRP